MPWGGVLRGEVRGRHVLLYDARDIIRAVGRKGKGVKYNIRL